MCPEISGLENLMALHYYPGHLHILSDIRRRSINSYLLEDKPMSNPTTETALKEFLLANDEQYRALASEHHQYDTRLHELSELPFPNNDEQLEEATLKKKKLRLKDQMEAIAHKYKSSSTSH